MEILSACPGAQEDGSELKLKTISPGVGRTAPEEYENPMKMKATERRYAAG